MIRPAALALCIALFGLVPRPTAAQATFDTKPVTVVATIAAIDQKSRTVTLRGSSGHTFDVNAPDAMQGFNSLKVGDQVSATYYEAVAIQVRKPGAAAPSSAPFTATSRQDRKPGSETRREQTFAGIIESIDTAAPSVTVKGDQGRSVTMVVRDKAQLQTFKVGDNVDVTYYQSLLVKVARPPDPKR